MQIKSANKQRDKRGATGNSANEGKSKLPGKLGIEKALSKVAAQYEDEEQDDAYENYFEK
jgi:hypothetical protein